MTYILLAKRFKEYLNLPPHLDLRADDTVDILGFLAFEMVRSLCVGGLEVKQSFEDSTSNVNSSHSPLHKGKRKMLDDALSSKSKRRRGEEEEEPWNGHPTPVSTLFLPPPEERTALQPHHIQDAFGRMQRNSSHMRNAGMKNWRGGLVRTRISFI